LPSSQATTLGWAWCRRAMRAPGHARAAITLCRRYQHITVRNAAVIRFAVKNDNHGGGPRSAPATRVVLR
jgi:hypothetical protein